MAIKAEGVTRAAEARRKERSQYWVYLDGGVKRYADASLGLMTTVLPHGPGVVAVYRAHSSRTHG